MYLKNLEFYSGSGYKQSGFLKKWKEKLLVFNLNTKVLQIQDAKNQTQKQIDISNYNLKKLGKYQEKWSIKLSTTSNEVKLGWNSEKEFQQWIDCFTGEWQKKQEHLRFLEEFDKSHPEIEPYIEKQPLIFRPKQSLMIRDKIENMIPHLPQFIQKDMEILLQNTLQNLDGFSDIQNFKQILDQENAKLYQDPNDNLHMKLVYYSKIEPRRIYDEHVMPSTQNWLPDVIKQFQVFPTKKGCSLVYLEFEFKEDYVIPRQHSIQDEERQEEQNNFKFHSSQSLNQNEQEENNKIRIVFTQKGFEKDGIYCVFRKYTGQEMYHDQIDRNLANQLGKYKIIRSALVVQPSNKQEFKSLLIEEIYVDCKDLDAGEKLLKILLLNITSSDRNLMQIQQEIQQITENVEVKNLELFETIQISIKLTESDIQRITSEQHQIQSKEEFQKLIEKVGNGQYILDAISQYSDQTIVSGLDKQLQTNDEEGHFLYTKFYRVDNNKGGLTYHNERLLKDQRSVLLNMIKRMGSNLIQGKSVMSVSLPIQIFESRSFLERMARAQGHAPIFLELAAKSNDPLQQLKQTIAFHMASFMMGIQQEKPFNPILGETFQGRILGCPIYLEQTSHHPPISNYIMFGRDYKLYGSFSPIVNMGYNSLSGEQHGHSIVHFQNTNLKFYYINQPFTVYNIITGQRNVNCHKRSFCFQPDLQLCAVIQFNPKDENKSFFSRQTTPIDHFLGKIYKVSPMCIQRCKMAHKTGSGLNLKLKLSKEEILETYDSISGRWTSHLDINGQRYWDINIHRPYVLELESRPLPSDCLYRLDLLLMKMKDIQRAQETKEKMEVDQRKDQKLRQKR
ncbi:unnamed protein product [Paramecium pentaurelia]|uniref:PH domain-containing protein n=1 Tax=Paramecium pentaurelia TaxID=43138 RepID=A0A8S1T7V2_9CILI|nr:unnamed protein product [Paramecium pentaurelia]